MKNRILSFIFVCTLIVATLFSDVSFATEDSVSSTETDAFVESESDAQVEVETSFISEDKEIEITGASAVGGITVTAKPTFTSVTKNKKTFNNGSISDLYNSSTGKCYACNYAVDHIISKNLDFYGLKSFTSVPWGSYASGLTNLGFKKLSTGMENVCLKHANASLINSSMKAFNFQSGDIIVMYACGDSSSAVHSKANASGCSKGTVGHVLIVGTSGWTNSDGVNSSSSYLNGVKYTGTTAGNVSNGKVYDMLVSVAEYSSVYSGGAYFEVYRMPEKAIPKVNVGLVKESMDHNITDNNELYTFEGATYDLYDIKNANSYTESSNNIKVGTFTINGYNNTCSVGGSSFVKDSGYETKATSYYGQAVSLDLSEKRMVEINGVGVNVTLVKNLPLSNYAVVETSSGLNASYQVSNQPTVLTFTEIDNGKFKLFSTYDSANVPQMNMILKKVGKSVIPSFDGTSLCGVTYKIEYYNNTKTEGEPSKQWYFSTDVNGEILFNSDHLNNQYNNSDFYSKNGQIVLPYGSIKITETDSLKNYILDKTTYTFVVDSKTTYVPRTFSNERDREIYLKILKKDKETKELITTSNASFRLWSYDKEVYVDNLDTDTSGIAISSIKLDFGKYRLEEEVAPLGYEVGESLDFEILEDGVYELVVDENGEYTGEELFCIDFYDSSKIPEISTKASSEAVNEAGEIVLDEYVIINDKVMYKGLIPGKEYKVCGALYDKLSKAPIIVDGENILSEVTFVPENEDGWLYINYELDTRTLEGKSIVCFETLFLNDREVAKHADINDEEQTVVVEKYPEESTVNDTPKEESTEYYEPKEESTNSDEPEPISETPTPKEIVNTVHTGDGTPLAAIIALCFVTSFGLLFVVAIKRKKFK